MSTILAFFTFRSVILLASSAFSILFVMLFLNIITVDEVVAILDMSPEAENAFRLIISRVQEVTENILDILSQLLTKLFSWAGVDVDLSKIQVDLSESGSATSASETAPAPASAPVESNQ